MALFTRLFQFRLVSLVVLTLTVAAIAVLGHPWLAQAGCGCDKPPPELADVRPNVTYAGMEVSLFHSSLQTGQPYAVTFTSGTTGVSATVQTTALTRRDLADGAPKPQLVVGLPAELPLGPTSISVADTTGTFLAIADDTFTVAPEPVTFHPQLGERRIADYQAAVSRAGIVYISLNIANIRHPRVFRAQAEGYPLRFNYEDVVFTNPQGFLMQLLGENMPGLFAVEAFNDIDNSAILQYSRHEFNSYVLQHAENQAHAVDPTDSNWHLDGSPHIDHDQLIVAIAATLPDGSLPLPGATPGCDLLLSTATLFTHGLAGEESVELAKSARTTSYHSQDGSTGAAGDVLSNGTVQLGKNAVVDGDATAFHFDLSGKSQITGKTITAQQPTDFVWVDMPDPIQELGALLVSVQDSLTLTPGSYHVTSLRVEQGGQLLIANGDGPVTLYITGRVTLDQNSLVLTTAADPEKFALYVVGNGRVELGNAGTFHGVVYAPESLIQLSNGAEFFGSFVGKRVQVDNSAVVHYDTALRAAVQSNGQAQGNPGGNGGSGNGGGNGRGKKK